MDFINVQFPDKSVRQFKTGITSLEIAESIGSRLAKNAIAAKVSGVLEDLTKPLNKDVSMEILTFDSPDGKNVYRHSASHILAQAVKRLFPSVKLAIGPSIEDGFYYDFDSPETFTPEVLERIEREMGKIIKESLPIVRRELERDEAISFFKEKGEVYKVELIEDLPDTSQISIYQQGEFTDLCAGPHLASTAKVKAYKLTSVAGAYWRGDEKRPMLQRIYGTAFESQKDLDEYLKRLEEAKKRDHRKIGKELDMFSIHEEGGPGLVYWHPKGALVRQLIEDFWRAEHRKRGYDIVYTPHIAKLDLWKTSGHWGWYQDNMYSPMNIDEVEYLLKPMNCPFHILMYKSQTRSYRELPMRWGELGTVYRYERSGVLHGLLRVRGFTQDDAHIFCRPDQLREEIVGVIDLAQFMINTFGYSDFELMLSVRDPNSKEKYAGSDEIWETAEAALRGALTEKHLPYVVGEGEAKFYGPAIDITLKDALGRGWQGPTIQVDFNLPERFDMTYMGEDGQLHRPVMIHRTVLGSMERFFGGLLEHHAGALPVWLSPVQVRVLPITERQHAYAYELQTALKTSGFRVDVDARNEKIGYKIRESEVEKIPYMLIVGDKEMESSTVAVRKRGEGDLGQVGIEELVSKVKNEIEMKK